MNCEPPETPTTTSCRSPWATSQRCTISERSKQVARDRRNAASTPRGVRGVEAALRRSRATCLERSLIVQRWLVAHGERHDVVVGVSGGSQFMEAHAWVESYDPQDQGE